MFAPWKRIIADCTIVDESMRLLSCFVSEHLQIALTSPDKFIFTSYIKDLLQLCKISAADVVYNYVHLMAA